MVLESGTDRSAGQDSAALATNRAGQVDPDDDRELYATPVRRLDSAARTAAGSNATARARHASADRHLARATRDQLLDGLHDLVVGGKTVDVLLRDTLITDPNAELAPSAFNQSGRQVGLALEERRHTGSARLVVSSDAVANADVQHL